MINVAEKLKETKTAIAYLQEAKVEIPEEALEIQEIMQRCLDAEGAAWRRRLLLSEVYEQCGNHREPTQRHALTPALRDDIRDELGYVRESDDAARKESTPCPAQPK